MMRFKIISPVTIVFFMAMMLLGFSNNTLAVPKTVFLRKVLCDTKHLICVKGSLYYDANDYELSFNGRVQKSTRAGVLTIVLEGLTEEGDLYKVKLRTAVEGKYSEIVRLTRRHKKKFGPAEQWSVRKIRYKLRNE